MQPMRDEREVIDDALEQLSSTGDPEMARAAVLLQSAVDQIDQAREVHKENAALKRKMDHLEKRAAARYHAMVDLFTKTQE